MWLSYENSGQKLSAERGCWEIKSVVFFFHFVSLSQYMWIGKQALQKLLGLFGRRVQQLQRTQPE
jgi:hypothetical protein